MLALEGLEIVQEGFRLTANLTVPKGARVAVMGPSGSGKSTLLGALAGFVAHRGRVRWDGAAIEALPPAARPLTILFQDHNLLPNLSAAQNVALGIDPGLGRAALARAGAALAEVGLAGLASRRPAQLSGGQAGRVALARALLRDRPLLLLDEPFAALGPGMRADLLDLVGRICAERGLTLLMVTHDPGDAARLCPLTVVVDEGRAAPPVATGALLEAPPPGLAAYLGRRAAPGR
jgi:thiamine transport system ATP-binding protein